MKQELQLLLKESMSWKQLFIVDLENPTYKQKIV